MTGRPVSPPPIVLASASPRRARYLSMLGLEFTVDPARIPEELLPGEEPPEHAERLARAKAGEVEGRHPESLVVAGDTVVALDGEVLGKPADREEAVAMLLRLSGRSHRVHSGLALALPGGGIRSGVSTTRVEFRRFGPAQARAYVDTGEPMDKAGAYGIQGMGAALARTVDGDWFGVAGLPVSLLVELLEESGWVYAFGGLRARGEAPS